MKLEARLPTAIDEGQASRLARDLYGFEATARALPGEYDDNFHLVAPDGSQRVLKVMHPARERSLITPRRPGRRGGRPDRSAVRRPPG